MRCARNVKKVIVVLSALTTCLVSEVATGKSLLWSPVLFSWFECGEKLGNDSLADTRAALFALNDASVDNSFPFLLFATTVIAAESGFNRKAVSSSGAVGLMQLTTVGAEEARQQCNLPHVTKERLLDSKTNIRYGTCLLRHYLNQVDNNQTLALVLYNGGYKQLTRFLKEGSLSKETAEYVLRVNSYLGRCIP